MAPNAPTEDIEDEELYSSWTLLIHTVLLICALWTSYYLNLKQIRVIHETVVSTFAGMIVGLIIRLSPGLMIQNMVTFNYTYFFNLLLPPIILNSGYDMQRETFFRNFGTILLFAFMGTFISALVIGILVWILALTGIDSLSLSLLDSMIFGSVLSATDPVTVLAIFQALKVDPKLYSIIFGESILNDAVSIVLYETLKQYRGQEFHVFNIFHGIFSFILKFGASILIGILIGLLCALILKHSQLRKNSSIESCMIALMAYSSYLLSNGLNLSGIVSLLFCGIILKHYAYDNMALKTKRTTKYMFNVLAQLSENFIFIYLGLTLFTKTDLEYKPFFIFFTAIFICIARYFSIFPLSFLVNVVTRYRYGITSIPQEYSIMLFWAGLRGAVAFALSAGLEGRNANAMLTTILVVVVISVMIFGASTNKMLEILKIRVGVDDGDNDSDEEYCIHDDEMKSSQTNTISKGVTVSSDSMNSIDVNDVNNLTTNESRQKHWFISFDDRYLKPFFTRQEEQLPPHGRLHNEDDYVENLGLVLINKQVNNIDENTKENHSRNSSDTFANVSINNYSTSNNSSNQSLENIILRSSAKESDN